MDAEIVRQFSSDALATLGPDARLSVLVHGFALGLAEGRDGVYFDFVLEQLRVVAAPACTHAQLEPSLRLLLHAVSHAVPRDHSPTGLARCAACASLYGAFEAPWPDEARDLVTRARPWLLRRTASLLRAHESDGPERVRRIPTLAAQLDTPESPVPALEMLLDEPLATHDAHLEALATRASVFDLRHALAGTDVSRAIAAARIATHSPARADAPELAEALLHAVTLDARHTVWTPTSEHDLELSREALSTLRSIATALDARDSARARALRRAMVTACLARGVTDDDSPVLEDSLRELAQTSLDEARDAAYAVLIAHEAQPEPRHAALHFLLPDPRAERFALALVLDRGHAADLRARFASTLAALRPRVFEDLVDYAHTPWGLGANAPDDVPALDTQGVLPDAWLDAARRRCLDERLRARAHAALEVRAQTQGPKPEPAAPAPTIRRAPTAAPAQRTAPRTPTPTLDEQLRAVLASELEPSQRDALVQTHPREALGARLRAVVLDRLEDRNVRARAGSILATRLAPALDGWVDRSEHAWERKRHAPRDAPICDAHGTPVPLVWAASTLSCATDRLTRRAAALTFVSLARTRGRAFTADMLAVFALELGAPLLRALRERSVDDALDATSRDEVAALAAALEPFEHTPAARREALLAALENPAAHEPPRLAQAVACATELALAAPAQYPRVERALRETFSDTRLVPDVDPRTDEPRERPLGAHAIDAWVALARAHPVDDAPSRDALARIEHLELAEALALPPIDLLLDAEGAPREAALRVFGARVDVATALTLLRDAAHADGPRVAAAVVLAPTLALRAPSHARALASALAERGDDARSYALARGATRSLAALALATSLRMPGLPARGAKHTEALLALAEQALGRTAAAPEQTHALLDAARTHAAREYPSFVAQLAERLSSRVTDPTERGAAAVAALATLAGARKSERANEPIARARAALLAQLYAPVVPYTLDAALLARIDMLEPRNAAPRADAHVPLEALLCANGAVDLARVYEHARTVHADALARSLDDDDLSTACAAAVLAAEVARGTTQLERIAQRLLALLRRVDPRATVAVVPTGAPRAQRVYPSHLATQGLLAITGMPAFTEPARAHALRLDALDRCLDAGPHGLTDTVLQAALANADDDATAVLARLDAVIDDAARSGTARAAALSIRTSSPYPALVTARVRDREALFTRQRTILRDDTAPAPLRFAAAGNPQDFSLLFAPWCDTSAQPYALHDDAPRDVPLAASEAPDAWLASALALAPERALERINALRQLEVRLRVHHPAQLAPTFARLDALAAEVSPAFLQAIERAARDLTLGPDQRSARALARLAPARTR